MDGVEIVNIEKVDDKMDSTIDGIINDAVIKVKNLKTSIVASFTYGRLISGKNLTIFNICFFVLIICQVIFLIGLIGISAAGNFLGENDEGFILIGSNIFVLLPLILISIIRKKNKKNRNHINNCLADAVELKAKVIRLDSTPLHASSDQLEVYFQFDDRNLIRTSRPRTWIDGSWRLFSKYHNRTIKILYSPSYDEVMIPKHAKDDH